MSLRVFIFILPVSLWATPLWAEDEPAHLDTITELESLELGHQARSWRLLVAAGHFTEFKKSVDAESYDNNSQMLLSLGLESGQFQYTLGHYQTDQVSGTGNFSVSSRRRSWLLDAKYFAKENSFWSPVVGGTVGAYRDNVKTRFGTLENTSESDILYLAGAFAGVQFRFFSVMYTDMIFKVVKRETSKEAEFVSQAILGLRL